MQHLRSRITAFLIWSALVLLSLRPVAPVERAVDASAAPLRSVARLASPFALLRRREVSAAEVQLSRTARAEAAENEALLLGLARFALPADPALREGRRLVQAEVLGRKQGNRDHVLLRLRDARGVVPGLPVVSGDAYVGRVLEVEPEAGTATVELVTAGHVGARVVAPEGTETLMTVGGVQSTRRGRSEGEVRLVVHNPSDRALAGGLARVHELFEEAEVYAPLAEGFRLGRVRRESGGKSWSVLPELDYLDGLYQVVVVCPSEGVLPSAAPFEHVLMDANWVRADPLGMGDPSPWRSATKVDVGRGLGVRDGAAVTAIGARLLGRVSHAGPWSSDVSFLGDVGFSLVAVARFPDEEEPRVLGRLVSLGSGFAGGPIRMRWYVRVGLEVEPPAEGVTSLRARLFTGSGDTGLPPGFFFGEAEIPLDARSGEVRVLELEVDVAPRDVRTLFVRTVPEELRS